MAQGTGRRKPISALIRSAVALMFSTVASSALGLVFWAVAAHIYDREQLGRASAGTSAITLVASISWLGFPTVLTRFLPTAGTATGKLVRTAYACVGAASFTFAILFFLSGWTRAFLPHGVIWPALFCICVVIMTYSSLQDVVLTGLRRTPWIPVENVGIAVLRILLLLVTVQFVKSAPVLAAWAIPMAIAVWVLSVMIFGPLIRAQEHASMGGYRLPKRKELVSFMAAQYLTGLLGNLANTLPPVLVATILGPSENAVFYIPWIVGMAFGALLWNLTSSFIVEAMADPENTGRHLRHAARIGAVIGLGGGLALTTLAPQLLLLVGSDYAADGAASLRWIGLALPFMAFNAIFLTSVLMERKPWTLVRLDIVEGVLFFGTSLLVMHKFGSAGVAAAFCLTQAAAAVVLFPTTMRRYRRLSERTVDDDVTQVLDLAALRLAFGYDISDVDPHDDRPTLNLPKIQPEVTDVELPTQILDRVVAEATTQIIPRVVDEPSVLAVSGAGIPPHQQTADEADIEARVVRLKIAENELD